MITEQSSSNQWRTRLLKLSLPIILSNGMVPIVGIVDTAVMGRMGSPEWIAATAVGALLFSSIYWIFGFLRMGTGGLVAQAYGSANLVEAGRVLARAICIAVLPGILLLVLQTPILQLGLAALDDKGEWKELTSIYYSVRIYSAPATLILYALLGALIGLQRMRQVLLLQLSLNLLNIVLTIGIFRFTSLDIAGVALATVISEYTTLLLGLYMTRDILQWAFSEGKTTAWLLNMEKALQYVSVSGNLFIRTVCLLLATYWMTVLGSRLGVAVLAANTVLLHLVELAAYTLDGYAHAIETLTGFATGRRNLAMFLKAVKAAVELALVSALAISGIYWLGSDWFLSLMTNDTEVQAQARQWLPWALLVPITGVWSYLLDGIFIGATRTAQMRDSMIVSLLVFGICTLILVPRLGNHGIWMSYHVMFIMRGLTLLYFWPRLQLHVGGQDSATIATHARRHD